MESLIVKISSSPKEEIRRAYNNPSEHAPKNTHTLLLKNPGELSTILSPKRIELLIFLTKNPEKATVSLAAKNLHRQQEAVSRDALILSKYSLISKTKEKQKVYLKPKYKSLELQIS